MALRNVSEFIASLTFLPTYNQISEELLRNLRESEKRRLSEAEFWEQIRQRLGMAYEACVQQLGAIGGVVIEDVEWSNPSLKWLFGVVLLIALYRWASSGNGTDTAGIGLPEGNRRPLWERIQGRGTRY